MKKTFTILRIIVFFAIITFSFAACTEVPKLTRVVITKIPNKVIYNIGEVFNPAGLEVTAIYSDGAEILVTDYTLSGFSSSELGSIPITVDYEGITTSFFIIVSQADIFTILFSTIIDLAPIIEGPTVYILPGREGKPTSITLTLDNPAQYDEDSIVWEISGTSITGNGASFILDSEDLLNNLIGNYFLTVEIKKDGIPYNKTVSFTVAP
ncbi:MAG: bacterial Ig-like domain-containing protein [Treponema sp.]|nr:bacterial Ig-like domain-containing protein [Treponema sp.]